MPTFAHAGDAGAPSSRPSVISVNVGKPLRATWAAGKGVTGIDKRPVAGPVALHELGVEGDHVLDTSGHGGIDQAVYAYAWEDTAWWAAELGRTLDPGNVGENLTTAGIDLTESVIGSRWAVGSAVLEVSRPRIPCRVFAGFWDVPDLIKRFTAHAHPGTYLRVLTPGTVAAGDPIEILHRPSHGVTIGVVFRALTLEPELLPRLLEASQLPQALRDKAARRAGTSRDAVRS
jgi:MOSC domain-containing protein YiiM